MRSNRKGACGSTVGTNSVTISVRYEGLVLLEVYYEGALCDAHR